MAIRREAYRRSYSAWEKHDLLRELGHRLGVDVDEQHRRRLLHLLSPEEVAALDPRLVQVHLHTHRHRVPLDPVRFQQEVLQNRELVRALAPRSAADHFCYPSGVVSPVFVPWLRALGIRSATTMANGLATRQHDALVLPRVCDTTTVSELEFEGWLSGTAGALLRREPAMAAPTFDGVLL
jgi:hypothetical protein